MPKSFQGERPLLFPPATIVPGEVNAQKIRELFDSRSSLSLSVCFDGFEKTCLGYVFHIRRHGKRYELLNISGIVQLIILGEEQLAALLKHVSGIEYSENMQATFHRIRNDIGKGSVFGDGEN